MPHGLIIKIMPHGLIIKIMPSNFPALVIVILCISYQYLMYLSKYDKYFIYLIFIAGDKYYPTTLDSSMSFSAQAPQAPQAPPAPPVPRTQPSYGRFCGACMASDCDCPAYSTDDLVDVPLDDPEDDHSQDTQG